MGFPHDSIYALILHRIGLYEFSGLKNYDSAIAITTKALEINNLGKKECSKNTAILSYYNIGFCCWKMQLYKKALLYFDTTITLAFKAKNFFAARNVIVFTRLNTIYIFLQFGDYQKAIEESTLAVNFTLLANDSLHYLMLLNLRAQAFFYQRQLKQSFEDVQIAIGLSQKLNQAYELATAYKMNGLVLAATHNFSDAEIAFKECIKQRILTKDYGLVADEYNNLGDFYCDSLKKYALATKYYFEGIQNANGVKDSSSLARINNNLGNLFYIKKNFDKAKSYYIKAFNYLKLNTYNFFNNPKFKKVNLVANKELLISLFNNKTELLLNQYLLNHKNKLYLSACINTALLTDSIITETRHEQLGEQSKLYWRDNTRDFYINAINACYLANDANKAFYFMEKSRAVLLNDRLNELGAAANLPVSEAEKEDSLRANIIELEQQLRNLSEGTKPYNLLNIKYLNAKENWQNYTQSLEQKFPVYFQYKYNDKVPDLKDLQQYLAKNDQAFVHYFITDSVIYVLGITPNTTKLIKVSSNVFSTTQLADFIKMCADKQVLNAHYDEYINLSNSIYTALFQPLQIQQKHLVICADNFLIPFSALCTDKMGKHFLIQDYAFSYAYSARSLLSPSNNYSSKGIFFGVAPVSFAASLQMPELKESAKAVTIAASAFKSKKLLLNKEATRNAFMKLLPQYRIVNVFSHANADSSDEEPSLFMADSVIHLSELQTITKPATQLVVLSACQTNVGKLATGEGIYSLARGFASVGIPSVAATLWSADEDAIYEITQLFDHNLVQGMRKDDALQQAEMTFMQHGGEKLYPYYWANMVLVGDAGPVKLSNPTHWEWLLSIAGTLLIIATFIIIKRRKSNSKKINIYSSL